MKNILADLFSVTFYYPVRKVRALFLQVFFVEYRLKVRPPFSLLEIGIREFLRATTEAFWYAGKPNRKGQTGKGKT